MSHNRFMGACIQLEELIPKGEILVVSNRELADAAVEFGPRFAAMLSVISQISRGEWHYTVDSEEALRWGDPRSSLSFWLHVGKSPVRNLLALQFRGDSAADYDAIVALEGRLKQELPHLSNVTSHDIGPGETNIFILTADPVATFSEVRRILEREGRLEAATVAYRDIHAGRYTVLWPENSVQEFKVADRIYYYSGLSVVARAAVALLCFERYCQIKGLRHPTIDTFLEHMWDLPSVRSPGWASRDCALVGVGLGGAFPGEVINLLGSGGALEEEFRKLIESIVDIIYGSLSGWRAGSFIYLDLDLERVLAITQYAGVTPPPVEPFMTSLYVEGDGWGPQLTPDERDRWRFRAYEKQAV